jgi:hypothetical protein
MRRGPSRKLGESRSPRMAIIAESRMRIISLDWAEGFRPGTSGAVSGTTCGRGALRMRV